MDLKICHMYPDVLNLYGDRGNILCLCQRLAWRGIQSEVTRLPVGSSAPLSQFDLIFIGGGQDFEQQVLLEDLHNGKDKDICSAVHDGLPFLTICGGYQLLGNYYQTHDGQRCDFIGAIDLYTVGAKLRIIGNYSFQCGEESGGCTVVGFENHSGRTYLGSGIKPLGKVLKGYGNNGEDGTEGVRFLNVFGTYSHGPLLPKNSLLCDEILRTALIHKYGHAELDSLDDHVEISAHDEMLLKLSKIH